MVDIYIYSGLLKDAEKWSPCKCLPIHSGPYMTIRKFFLVLTCIDHPNDRLDPKQNEPTQHILEVKKKPWNLGHCYNL